MYCARLGQNTRYEVKESLKKSNRIHRTDIAAPQAMSSKKIRILQEALNARRDSPDFAPTGFLACAINIPAVFFRRGGQIK
jgi:hypothetical protein